MRTEIRLATGLALCCVPMLLGCPNPNTYGTPRVAPKGSITHTVALEAFQFRYENKTTTGTPPNTTTTTTDDSITLPSAPTYQLRYSFSDEVDIGFSLRNFSSLGADVKWNFLRSRIDLAVAPGAQLYYYTTGSVNVGVAYLNAPLMLGINLAEALSIVAIPGFTYAAAFGSVTAGGRDAATTASAPFGRLGLGLNIRPSKSFALQPEVTAMRALNDSRVTLLVIGLGFNFGKLPTYDDLDGETKPSGPPAMPPAGATPPPTQPTPAPTPAPAPASGQPAPG